MKSIIYALLLLPVVLAGQSYDLDQLVQYGLEHSWSMQGSQLTYQSSRSNLSSATWNLMPDVDLNFNIRNDFYHPDTPAKSDLSSSAGFTISKTISLNDEAWFAYRNASLDAEQARMTYDRGVSSYAYSVFSAYIAVLSAQKQLASLTENLAIQTRVWEQSKVLLQLGKTTSFDVKQNEIAVMNSQVLILQMQNTISTKRQELFGLVQMEDEGHPLADIVPELDWEVPEFDTAGNAELAILESSIRQNKLNRTQNVLGYFPRLSLAYNYNRQVSGEDFNMDTYSGSHTVSLIASYSLWGPMKQRQMVKRSGFALRQAELQKNDKLDELQRQYLLLTQELQYMKRLDELYTEKLAQSREQIKIAEERYRLGLIELLELDKVRNDYIDADINYNTNRYQIIAQQQQINYLLSKQILGKW
jgi:outer membrane protein TolC